LKCYPGREPKYDPRITRIFIDKVLELDLTGIEEKAI